MRDPAGAYRGSDLDVCTVSQGALWVALNGPSRTSVETVLDALPPIPGATAPQ
jgi:hypothetical protein